MREGGASYPQGGAILAAAGFPLKGPNPVRRAVTCGLRERV